MDPVSLLLVDDSLTFLEILKRYLEQHYRHEVIVLGTAGGGEEALVLAQRLRPNIVLIDLAMPGVSGLEAIPRLRAALPDTGIIALTFLEPNGYRPAALTAGADEFVTKANLGTDLLPVIRRVMRNGLPRENLG